MHLGTNTWAQEVRQPAFKPSSNLQPKRPSHQWQDRQHTASLSQPGPSHTMHQQVTEQPQTRMQTSGNLETTSSQTHETTQKSGNQTNSHTPTFNPVETPLQGFNENTLITLVVKIFEFLQNSPGNISIEQTISYIKTTFTNKAPTQNH